MAETLRIQLLGGLQIRYGHQSICSVESPRLVSLLALLLVQAGRPQPRQRLAYLFWPDSTDAQAQTNLRVLIHRLRRSLPDPDLLISADSRSLVWRADGPYSLDVEEFRSTALEVCTTSAVDRAIELYRGDLLPESYDDWIAAERGRLRDEFARLLSRAILRRESERDYGAAIRYTHRLVEHEPLDEEAYQRLMRLLALAGNRAAAARVYRECEYALRRELGIGPAQETRRLYDAIVRPGGDSVAHSQKTANVPPHNLPAYPSSFVGRQREVEAACTMLRSQDVRLLTLLGTGGIGKTRLAIQIARELLPDFSRCVFLVSLASVTDSGRVAASIAHALGIQPARARSLGDTLKEYLRETRVLLLLDNMEHLLDATPLVSDLLLAAPHLKVLTTSRQPLRLYGEHVFPVPTLAVPDRGDPMSADTVGKHEAGALFLQRARAADPRFVLTDTDAPAVAELCRRLDGLPLAIELAAARSRMLSPADLLQRLGESLGILAGAPTDGAPRHQALGDTIAWSYNLLSPSQRTLFARLAVFSGGFTMGAVQSVCMAAGDVIDVLEALVDKSLVRCDQSDGGQRRFTMLETIHAYALENLERSGEAEALRRRHIDYYVQLSEAAEPKLRGMEQHLCLRQLAAERDNLRAALVQAFAHQEYEKALRLIAAVSRIWSVRGYLVEWDQWIEAACAVGSRVSPALLAEALRGAGAVAAARGDFRRAANFYGESLSRMRESGDGTGIIHVLHGLGSALWILGDYDGSVALFEESLALRRELGDQQHMAVALSSLGWMSLLQGDLGAAVSYCEQSLLIFAQLGDKRGTGIALSNLGKAALEQADYARARELLIRSREMLRAVDDLRNLAVAVTTLGLAELGQERYTAAQALFDESLRLLTRAGGEMELASTLEGLIGLASSHGDAERVSRLCGAVQGLREAAGTPQIPIDRARYERYQDAARMQIDPVRWTAAWTEGRIMTREQIFAYAQGYTARG